MMKFSHRPNYAPHELINEYSRQTNLEFQSPIGHESFILTDDRKKTQKEVALLKINYSMWIVTH